ncbi:uncharacterized protein J4E79_008821 [Alternaria viburni]|uniref:uncharacterized protein n=1 Tax=Alternaria viburni TaxID=566460 RepID=UPI0020C2890D|nr:uncharacterized protein J4E79_008821 [Alternaria viburni]KAI4652515.1 hypothetical protein J4E79_008821 [Alternaria viburni]
MGFAPSSSATAKQPSMSSSDSTGLAPSSSATAKQPSFFAAQMAALQSMQPWTPSQIAATSTSASSAFQSFNVTSSSDVQITSPFESRAQSPALATKNSATHVETPARKTIFIVQVRSSAGVTYSMYRRLNKRPAAIWEAYLRAHPLPGGTEAVRYRKKDTKRLELSAYGYILSHQWSHRATERLIIDDSDDTLARKILDLTDQQPLHIVVIGTGIDGLSVSNESWKLMQTRWPKATFELCLMVPKDSPYLAKFPQIASMHDDYFTTIRVQTSDLASAFETAEIDAVRTANASIPRNKMIVLLFLLAEYVSTEKSNWGRRHADLHEDSEMAALAKTLGLRKVSRNLDFELNRVSSRSDDAGEPQKKGRKTNTTPSVSINDFDSDYGNASGDGSEDDEALF